MVLVKTKNICGQKGGSLKKKPNLLIIKKQDSLLLYLEPVYIHRQYIKNGKHRIDCSRR